ncbi:unnamed protein product [Heligmosomoides polygyrus]|uniref:Uncharacterized protein n=1 Tax=Heligmosomoides polygyrus TaxID=6339 RepID=A0A183FE75_HELPZ|nr:unnamed protein product [Heligmosomoides polygyrus]
MQLQSTRCVDLRHSRRRHLRRQIGGAGARPGWAKLRMLLKWEIFTLGCRLPGGSRVWLTQWAARVDRGDLLPTFPPYSQIRSINSEPREGDAGSGRAGAPGPPWETAAASLINEANRGRRDSLD